MHVGKLSPGTILADDPQCSQRTRGIVALELLRGSPNCCCVSVCVCARAHVCVYVQKGQLLQIVSEFVCVSVRAQVCVCPLLSASHPQLGFRPALRVRGSSPSHTHTHTQYSSRFTDWYAPPTLPPGSSCSPCQTPRGFFLREFIGFFSHLERKTLDIFRVCVAKRWSLITYLMALSQKKKKKLK